MKITNEDIGAFFEDMKRGTYKCAFCANESFIGNTIGVDTANFLIPASVDADLPASAHHAFVTIVCNNCGNTTFFHINQFNKWRAKKKAAGS